MQNKKYELIEEIHSSRIRFEYNLEKDFLNVINKENKVIGYIKEIESNNGIILEFDLKKEYEGIGLQTEILREFLRYKYLWEKKCDIIACYPNSLNTINVLKKRFFINDGDKYYINKDIYFSHIEKLTLFDDDFNRLPYPNYRGERILNHTHAGVVDIIIKNKKTNKFLTTKRDLNKPTNPGVWEITAGGIDYNEKVEDALVREAKEETGLDIIEYKFLNKMIIEDLAYFTFIGYVDCDESSVKLQKGETIDYKWREKEELVELYKTADVPKKQKIRIGKVINLL